MPELTTLALLAGFFMTLFAGQAVMYSNTFRVQIYVPGFLADKGLNETVAEKIFTSEAAQIIRGESIVPAPDMRIESERGLLAALLQPLALGAVVPALQSQFGIDNLSVVAGVLQVATRPATGEVKPLEMVLVVTQAQHGSQQTRIIQDDGDPVALVQRSAAWTMEHVSPYRVALHHFLRFVGGDANGLAQARETVSRALATVLRPETDPWDSGAAAEYAMLYSINGLIAAAGNDLPAALAAYHAIERIPQVPPAVRAEVALNKAVIWLALKQPGEAAALLQQARANQEHIHLPGFAIDLQLVEGLIAWGNGDLENAEHIFVTIAKAAPQREAAHRYAGQVRAARGNRDGAARALNAADMAHHAEPPQEELAVQLFWVDPVAGGLTRRF